MAVKKPRFTTVHKQKRLLWAKEHKNWTVEEWKRVLWSDESKFEIFGNKRRSFVRRRIGERMLEQRTMQTIKHGGGNIMVWGCFGGGQVGSIAKMDGKMTKEVYLKILKEHVLVCGTKLIGERFVFQQDNDPKHTEEGLLKVMIWPPQSPDCNPIELLSFYPLVEFFGLLDHLDREVRKCDIFVHNCLVKIFNPKARGLKLIYSQIFVKLYLALTLVLITYNLLLM